ncbi:hypothetical protein HUT16_22880 [Kitasatospora sp. NA04385]|uniref:hypothetical protein n=1 Tax=Kitasatospora sp. NA04385 TaxID=2742135 RepID=UPI001591A4D1|nr:hypothetical protein [Kitasatospora sp. NA04385]QKW21527.1 hypothetical protein HUT16_22880 [Kitasatospora sp. NA04385]
MNIKWAALAETAGVSLLVTVAVVVVFALGNLALSRREAAVTAGTGRGVPALVAAGFCFAACAAVVLYGISLIAAK